MYRIVFSFSKLLFLLVVLGSCGEEEAVESLPYYNTPDFTPIFIDDQAAIEKQVDHTISNFSFTNHKGQTISEQSIEDKIHVANFIFTSCVSICPIMTNNMKLVEAKFANHPDFAMLSYSVTPWIDTVDKLAAYAKNQEIESNNWHLLTGKQETIYNLARRSYFAEEDIGFTKDSTEFLHTEHFILVDKSKRIRGIYNGTLELEMGQLIADVRVLMGE